jgi:hypothetical protein
MTKADEFRQYADEALQGASKAKSEQDREVLVKLARLWSQAAASTETPSTPDLRNAYPVNSSEAP